MDHRKRHSTNLITANDSSAHMARTGFSLVRWNHDRKTSNGKAGDDTSNHDLVPFAARGSYLNGHPNAKDNGPHDDRVFATKYGAVGNGPCNQGSDEGADGELMWQSVLYKDVLHWLVTYHADNQTGANIAEAERICLICKVTKEIIHFQEAGNLASIVTKAETSK